MKPDQLLFEDHLRLPEFTQGEILGYWGIVNEKEEREAIWPLSFFWISVPPRGTKQITKYYLRLELTNYNVLAPAGCFWDIEKNVRLDNSLWPRVTGPFARGFRIDWQNAHELYAPWDKGGLQAHPEWATTSSAVAWKSGNSKIHNYLEIMYEILNSENYHGTNAG
ncbi:MAG: hypothetical protein JST48_10660 [Bacteroidetes bacterium]|nr:hypothetical protein [Bacteroidota bacterium]